jgi:hypothetical protein
MANDQGIAGLCRKVGARLDQLSETSSARRLSKIEQLNFDQTLRYRAPMTVDGYVSTANLAT